MKYNDLTFETYQLKITDKSDLTCSLSIFPKTGKALNKERRKIYIVTNDSEILYIGEANSSILIRFQRGCTAYNYYKKNQGIARNVYKGYKWLDKNKNSFRELNIYALVFNEDMDDNRSFVEAAEGELVYLIRNKKGYWPKFQNEIHFSNCDGAKEIAEGILEKCISGELV